MTATRKAPRFLLVVLVVSSCSIWLFGQNAKSSAAGIFVDNTGSLRTQLEFELELAREIVKQLDNKTSVSLFGFATDPKSPGSSPVARFAAGMECTTDKGAVNRQIDQLFTVGGQTALLDAIGDAADRLAKSASANCSVSSDRILFVITDGEDRSSVTESRSLFDTLKQTGIKVYAVGLMSELGSGSGLIGKSPKQKARVFLESLASETDGKVVYPEKHQSAAEIVALLLESAGKKPPK